MLGVSLLTAVSCCHAILVVEGVHLEGSIGEWLGVVLVMTAVFQIPGGIAKLIQWVGRPRSCPVALLMLLTNLLLVFPGYPALLQISVLCCEWLGLPIHVGGFWSAVAPSVVILLGPAALGHVQAVFAQRFEDGLGVLARFAASCLALWLMLGLTGVRLEEAPLQQQVPTMLVLAILFQMIGIRSFVYGDAPMLRRPILRHLPTLAVGSLVANMLVLWLVSWVSETVLAVTLSVAGFGTFLVAAALATILMWAVTLPTLLDLRRPDAWICLRVSRFGYIRPLPKEREEHQRRQEVHRSQQIMMPNMTWPNLHPW